MTKRITTTHFLISLSIGLLFYTTLRAMHLSLTCDEASTYFSHVPRNLWVCFFSNECWSDANNHWLNSFLMQLSVGIFGVSELSLRLPNLFAHWCYLICSVLLIQQISKNFWVSLAGFCLLNFNPFLLEFFSLARGYGLGVGMMMGSIYFLFLWIKDGKLRWAGLSFFAAALAVLSNFVFLNYWAVLTATFCLLIIMPKLGGSFKLPPKLKSRFSKEIAIPFFTAVLLFLLLKTPIGILRAKGEFVFGAESLATTISELVNSSVMGQGYINPFTQNVFVLLSLVFAGISVFFGIYFFYQKIKNTATHKVTWSHLVSKRSETLTNFYFATTIILLLILTALVVQYHLLGVQYLIDRKAIILIPLFTLLVYLWLEKLYEFKKKLAIGLSLLFSVFFLNHFERTSNLESCKEWSYDQHTKDMVVYLKNKIPEGQSINLNVYWIFKPATRFYQEQIEGDQIRKVQKIEDEELGIQQEADYIYVRKNQLEMIPESYVREKEFGDVGVLLKKK